MRKLIRKIRQYRKVCRRVDHSIDHMKRLIRNDFKGITTEESLKIKLTWSDELINLYDRRDRLDIMLLKFFK